MAATDLYSATINLPTYIRAAIKRSWMDPTHRAEMDEMFGRNPWDDPRVTAIAAMATDPKRRMSLDAGIDAEFAVRGNLPIKQASEVVIGSGLHAAIYCAVRVAQGFEKPVVLEASDRVGGVFACSRKPSFWLNSSNRPGPLSVPGDPNGALNFIPGAWVQPSDVSGQDYGTNADMALCIRLALATCAKRVFRNRTVRKLRRATGGWRIYDNNDVEIKANRVVIATGQKPKEKWSNVERCLTFDAFMASMDTAFPMKGMTNIAVIGDGDSARAAIEAICGQGPTQAMTVASVDRPQVDWYGTQYLYRGDFEEACRSRYKAIGRLLPKVQNGPSRVTPKERKIGRVEAGYQCAIIDDLRRYDLIVDCTGRIAGWKTIYNAEMTRWTSGGRTCGLRDYDGLGLYVVGPAAEIAVGDAELEVPGASYPSSQTAIFRYADRTATLAASLSAA